MGVSTVRKAVGTPTSVAAGTVAPQSVHATGSPIVIVPVRVHVVVKLLTSSVQV